MNGLGAENLVRHRVLAGADVVDQDAGSYVPSLGRRNHTLLGVHYQSENEGQVSRSKELRGLCARVNYEPRERLRNEIRLAVCMHLSACNEPRDVLIEIVHTVLQLAFLFHVFIEESEHVTSGGIVTADDDGIDVAVSIHALVQFMFELKIHSKQVAPCATELPHGVRTQSPLLVREMIEHQGVSAVSANSRYYKVRIAASSRVTNGHDLWDSEIF